MAPKDQPTPIIHGVATNDSAPSAQTDLEDETFEALSLLDSLVRRHDAASSQAETLRTQLLHTMSEHLIQARHAASSSDIPEELIDVFALYPDGLCIWDSNDRFVFCNRRHHELHRGTSKANGYVPGRRYEDTLRIAVRRRYPRS